VGTAHAGRASPTACAFAHPTRSAPFGTLRLPEPGFRSRRFSSRHDARANSHADERNEKEQTMPVIFLWGIPAIVVIGGGVYWIAHMH